MRRVLHRPSMVHKARLMDYHNIRRFNDQMERLLSYQFDPRDAAGKVFQSSAVGFGMAYGSKSLDPATAALFCGLSELVAQVALPKLWRAIDNAGDNRVLQGCLWASYIIARIEVPRQCFLLGGSALLKYCDYDVAIPLAVNAWGITGAIRLVGGFISDCMTPQRRFINDPFLDEHFQ